MQLQTAHSHEVSLPVLDTLSVELSRNDSNGATCRAPISDNRLQVGFRGTPESMTTINIHAPSPGSLAVDLHGAEVEGPVIDREANHTIRHTTPALGILVLHKTLEGPWSIDRKPDEAPLSGNDRLVLTRALAKLGEKITNSAYAS